MFPFFIETEVVREGKAAKPLVVSAAAIARRERSARWPCLFASLD
jgi:hypothetical protein